MERAGAAVLLDESELKIPNKLLDALTSLLQSPERLAVMAAAARTQAHPDAAERIANRIAALAEPGTPVPPPQ
jgi:UDP-N-acetylglucosamine:LPS N-acetylglucosamine transferase